MSCYFDITTPDFPYDLQTEVDVRCGVKVNVSALLIFVSSLSIMLRPTQAKGEVPNVLTFSLIEFKSRFSLSFFVYPNLTSNCAGWHPKFCLIIGLRLMLPGSSLQPLLLVHVLLFSCLHKNQHFKIPVLLRIRVCLGLSVNTVNIFIQFIEFAKIKQNHGHDKIVSGKTDTLFY